MEMGAENLRKKGFDLVFDRKEMFLHKIDCSDIENIPSDRLEGYWTKSMPNKIKFCPCPKCFPTRYQQYKERTTGLHGRRLITKFIRENADKTYVKDVGLDCIHRLHSPCVHSRPIRFLTAVSFAPDDMPLCKQCFSIYSDEYLARQVRQAFVVDQEQTPENVMQAISKICTEHFMFVSFVSSTAYITTVAGRWHFDFEQKPITLYHASYVKAEQKKDRLRYLMQDGVEYHQQDQTFETAQDVLLYIVFHDDSMVRRIVSQKRIPVRSVEELEHIIVTKMEDNGLRDNIVADTLGISEQALDRYLEDGLKTMPLHLLEKLSEILDMSPDFFLDAISDISDWRVG